MRGSKLSSASMALAAWALTRRNPVRIARREDEKRAIFRMRYAVYVEERGERDRPGADHANRLVHTADDDAPETTHFYLGRPEAPLASMRMRVWKPGKLPADFRGKYSLELFADIHTRTVMQAAYLLARPSVRGTAAVVALISAALEHTIREHGAEMMIIDCSPGLIRSYLRIGLRPYGGRVISSTYGVMVPMVGMAEPMHMGRVDSPLYPAFKRMARAGQLPRADLTPIEDVVKACRSVVVEPEPISRALEECADALPGGFPARLPSALRRLLCKEATLLEIAPNIPIVEQGNGSRDLFVVLAGQVGVFSGERHLRTLGSGDVFGEVAYFHPRARRSASVRSLSAVRLVHIPRGLLRRWKKDRPADAAEMYEALAGVIAERLTGSFEPAAEERVA